MLSYFSSSYTFFFLKNKKEYIINRTFRNLYKEEILHNVQQFSK